jgi:hypothetical protein
VFPFANLRDPGGNLRPKHMGAGRKGDSECKESDPSEPEIYSHRDVDRVRSWRRTAKQHQGKGM